jgi:hypothetical protein
MGIHLVGEAAALFLTTAIATPPSELADERCTQGCRFTLDLGGRIGSLGRGLVPLLLTDIGQAGIQIGMAQSRQGRGFRR